jgi:Ser/Thr protein kinase RdoA (MazF antagonist)
VRIGDVVARIDRAARGTLRKEAALLRRVAGAGVRVPRVLGASDRVLLLEYVDHAELPDSEHAGECVGRAAAAIHAHRFGCAGFLDAQLQIPEPFSSAYDGLRAWGEEQLAHERLAPWRQRVRAAWDKAEARMREVSEDPVLVHADFKPANVKWVPAEQGVVVFDWEFTWSGPALMDLGQMLRWGVPAPFARGLERGYGDLPRDWQRLGELFDLFNLVAFVADGSTRPIRTRDAITRIEATLRGHG